MEEPKERPNESEMSNNIASPRQQVKKDIAEKLYQVLSFCESSIIQEIDTCKKDEIRMNGDIMLFSSSDKRREWKKQHIKDLEKDLLEVNHELPMTSVPRTNVGFFPVTKNDTSRYGIRASKPINIGTDKKRCHNRLNKGGMDLEYSIQVQEEILLSKKSINGAQELNYVMESLVHRIRHGNNKRAEEAQLYHWIRYANDTKEIYTEPPYTEPPTVAYDPDPWRRYWRRQTLPKGYKQHQLKIVTNQLEKARAIRKGQLKHELDLLRKNIKCMEGELEKISSLRKKAYKCAYKHGEHHNAVKSSYTEYQSLMTYVKELARRGDIEELMQVCRRQLAF